MIYIIRNNDIIFEAPLNSGARCVCKMMTEEYIELVFSVVEPFHFLVGDYVDLSDERYDSLGLYRTIRKKYVVTDVQVPTYNKTTGGYDWKLRLNAYYWAWNNRLFKFMPHVSAQEATWGLTDTIDRFMAVVIDNLKVYGFGDYGCIVDDDFSEYVINVSFKGNGIIDAIKMICAEVTKKYEVDCEWWVEGNTIRIGRCEEASAEVISMDDNAENITAKKATDYANRLVVFGGTDNLSARYRKNLYFKVGEVESEGGKVRVYDNVKTELSVSMFPTRCREEKDSVSFNADTDHGGGSQWIEDYAWDRHENVKAVGTYKPTSPTLSVDVDVSVDMQMAIYTNQQNQTPPDTETEPDFRYKIRYAEVVLYLERNGNRVTVMRDTFEAATILDCQEVVNIHMVGSPVVDVPDYSGGDWQFVLYSNFLYYDNPPETDRFLGKRPFSTFDTRCSVVVKQAYVYRVNTVVLFPGTGRQYPCTINEGYSIIRSKEGKTITIYTDDTISQGDIFTFPEIVKGKVPSGYFSNDIRDTLVNGIVQRNLMLPQEFSILNRDGRLEVSDDPSAASYIGKNYIDLEDNLPPEGIVEKLVTFNDIFPKQKLYVGANGYYTKDNESEEEGMDTDFKKGVLTKTHYYWQFILDNLEFNEDCLIEGVEMGITFNTGRLAGMTFGVAWKPKRDAIGTKDHNHRWEVINNEDYGMEIPNSSMHPETGDEFILTGWNCESLEDNTIVTYAERELLEEAIKYGNRIKADPYTYKVDMMSDCILNYPTADYPMKTGVLVTIKDGYIFQNGEREVRIVGYEVKLDIPYDTPIISAGEKLERSNSRTTKQRLDNIDNNNISSTPLITQ